MKNAIVFLVSLCLSTFAVAGFRVKLVKPKKPEQFQTRMTIGKVTYAADLLIEGKEQNQYFYKELTPAQVIAVRLCIYNQESAELSLPLDRLQLIDPAGQEVALVPPETVAQALVKGLVVSAEVRDKKPVQVSPGVRDPRYDPTDPRYDPRYDPRTDPRYDPRTDPRYDPRTDPTSPRYDPSDPRNSGRYPNGPYGRPGVDVVLNPGGGRTTGDLSQFEKVLVEKDFSDKAHSLDPIPPSATRDKFLFFSIKEKPSLIKGFKLRLPPGKAGAQEVVLLF